MKKDYFLDDHPCSVVLKENAEEKLIKGTNAFTHDDYSKRVYVHTCRGYVKNVEIVIERFDRWESSEITAAVAKVEKRIESYVSNEKAKKGREKELAETLKKLGFALLLIVIHVCAYSQVSRFYKDGQWWVSWDRKDADVQVFRPASDSLMIYQSGATWVNSTLTSSDLTLTVENYRAKCKGHTFSIITDSMFNVAQKSYTISFKDGTAVESGVQCYMNDQYVPGPPWTTEKDWFTKHLMFKLMAACYDDKWLYCPCGAKFPLVKK